MDLLKSRKITARYLSDKYEISLRSVYRYVDVLSSSGVPVFSERGRRGGITIADNYRLPATLLTKTEQSDILSALSLYKGADPLCDVDVIRDKLLSVNTSDDAEKLIMSGDKLILEGVIGDEKLYRAKIEPLSKAIDENKSTDELKKLSEELQQTMFAISQKAYEAVQKEGGSADANSAGNENASSEKKDDDVIDAEFTKE